MRFAAPIAGKMIRSDRMFILFSHTNGLVSAHHDFDEAREAWIRHVNECAERGRDSDLLIFRSTSEGWAMCGNLYDIQESHPILIPTRLR